MKKEVLDKKENVKLEKEKRAKLKKENKSRRLAIRQLKKNVKKAQKDERKLREAQINDVLKNDINRGRIANWFKLDNAAMIYPAARGRDWNFVFRISAVLKDKVNVEILQKTVDEILPRFPSFNVSLKSGFFWNYFDINFNRLKVQEEKDFPCKPFDIYNTHKHLIRILYTDYKISFECFHALSDGRGGLFFFNTLIARYLINIGESVPESDAYTNAKDLPTSAELEDSFLKNYTKEKCKRPKEKPAFKIKGELLPANVVNSTTFVMSSTEVKKIAKEQGLNIGAFLAAVVGFSVQKENAQNKKPVRISVPIDLRDCYNSQTLRNFSSYINIEFPMENFSFDDAAKISKEAIASINKEFLQSNINSNVSLQKNPFIKAFPLFVKAPIMKMCFNYMGENYQTLALSNIGNVNLPDVFSNHIERLEVNLGKSKHNEKSIGIVGFNDVLVMTISSKIQENITECNIANTLVSLGVNVTVESNRRDLYARH